MKIQKLLFTLLLLCTFITYAQKDNHSSLTIKEIMQGEDFIGHLPSEPNWAADGSAVYFEWNPDTATSDSLYSYNLKSSAIQKVDFDTDYDLPSPYATFNTDRSKKSMLSTVIFL